MRKFTRLGAPDSWVENQERWNQQWKELLEKNPKAAFAWYKHNGKSSRDIALPFLKEQTQNACSFCGAFPTDHVSPDTIEHFRPKAKGRFPQNAYTWENLYYCCAACQLSKGEKWDDGLLAPDQTDYEFARYFEFDFTTGQIRAAATANNDEAIRAHVTIRLYGLDLETRRRARRLEQRKWTVTEPDERDLTLFGYRDFLDPAVFAPAATPPAESNR